MRSKRIVMFNGPMRAGKDTGADAVLGNWAEAVRYKFTTPMDIAIPALFNIKPGRWRQIREELKDTPVPEFRGKTFREIIIPLSEEWAKPLLGQDIFGWLGANEFLPDAPLIVTSDSGFEPEAVPFIERVGAKNVLLFRVHRNGCVFDSRSYIELEKYGVKCIDIHNNGAPVDYKYSVINMTSQWLETTY